MDIQDIQKQIIALKLEKRRDKQRIQKLQQELDKLINQKKESNGTS
tara:strand:+ start:316 stop:453 length:138 start_codon:yes stop_codon:yes gene_type:complete